METQPPSALRVATMALFALSCVGLLLFLWLSFGGTMPFNAQGYTFKAAFPYADQLGEQADVRIAGVSVGKVIAKTEDESGNRTIATIRLDNKYAPIRKNARAMLRIKTILGETYVDLTPGTKSAPILPDDGMLPLGHVQPAVQLDQIFNAFTPATRRAFQVWQEQLEKALRGNDENLNNVLGNLPTFAADTTDILQVLDVQHNAVVNLLQNGGTVFDALDKSQSALRDMITSGETTFATTAANENALAAAFARFPHFLDESKATLADLQTFAVNTDPLLRELEPVAADLGPTLHSVQQLSPYLRHFFTKLGPLITVSKTGLPALQKVLKGATPLLGSLGPFLDQLNPIIDWLSLHQQLLSDFISDGAGALGAKTTVFGGDSVGHYLRQIGPTGAETLSIYQNRDANNRGDTYPDPLWLANPRNFIENTFASWDCGNTGSSANGGQVSEVPGTLGHQACWIAPTLPGATAGHIPELQAAMYSKK